MKKTLIITLICMVFAMAFPYNIVTSIKPLYLIMNDAFGSYCNVSFIISPLSNPHTFQMKPSDMVKFEKANLIVLVGKNFESWSPKIYSQFKNKTLLLDHTLLSSAIEYNPHFWIDPVYTNLVVDMVYSRLNSNIRKKTLDNYIKFKLSLINEESKILSLSKKVKNSFFLTVHPAFYYLLNRYGFTVRSLISGGESSITSKDLIYLIKYAQKHGIKRIYAVEGLSAKLAKPLIDADKLKLINIDFLGRGSNNYISYLNNIATSLFGENK